MKKIIFLLLISCSSQAQTLMGFNTFMSGLPAASNITSATFPILQGGVSKQASVSLLGSVLTANSPISLSGNTFSFPSWPSNSAGALTNNGSGTLSWTTFGSLATLNSVNNSNWSGTALSHSNIASTTVTPGSYTNANITVAADGSITAASNGSGGGTVQSGTYTPTTVSSTNTSSVTWHTFRYLRINNIVHISGQVSIVPSSTSNSTQVIFPVLFMTSNFPSGLESTGVATEPFSSTTGAINASTSSTNVVLNFTSPSSIFTINMSIELTYTIY